MKKKRPTNSKGKLIIEGIHVIHVGKSQAGKTVRQVVATISQHYGKTIFKSKP